MDKWWTLVLTTVPLIGQLESVILESVALVTDLIATL